METFKNTPQRQILDKLSPYWPGYTIGQRAKQETKSTYLAKHKNNKTKKQKQTDILLIEQDMSESFGHQISIEAKNKQKGSVQISYKTSDELETIISKILS